MSNKVYDLGDGELHTEEEFLTEVANALEDCDVAIDNSPTEPDENDDAETWAEYHDAQKQVEECEERLEELYGIMEDNPPAQENEATRALEDWWIAHETDEPTEEEIEDYLDKL